MKTSKKNTESEIRSQKDLYNKFSWRNNSVVFLSEGTNVML